VEARFWRRAAKLGTPLMEPIPGDPTHWWVTYVWHGDPRLESVGLIGPQTDFGTIDRLERLPRTQVWYRTFKVRGDGQGTYMLLPNPPSVVPTDLVGYLSLWRAAKPDPLNSVSFISAIDPEYPKGALGGHHWSVLQLPCAPHHRELEVGPRLPRGTITEHRIRSRILNNTRRLWVYRPAEEGSLTSSNPLVIFFDGFRYMTDWKAPTILDNLIHRKRIPPTCAVFVDQRDGATRNRELPAYPPFGRFLASELVPWIRRTLGFSPSPNRTVLAGMSYGGLASMYWASRHPKLFQNVISQSGSVAVSPPGTDEPVALARYFMRRPKLPLTIYMDVGRYEARSETENDVGHLGANRHVRDILRMRGYPLLYREYCGGHDFYCCRQSLVDALRWILSQKGSAS
jgi:enterochelin esterase-like enzyme